MTHIYYVCPYSQEYLWYYKVKNELLLTEFKWLILSIQIVLYILYELSRKVPNLLGL